MAQWLESQASNPEVVSSTPGPRCVLYSGEKQKLYFTLPQFRQMSCDAIDAKLFRP